MNSDFWILTIPAVPLTLTFLAGISTGIGSTIALFAKKTNTWLLAAGLGFSAGVMIYISFVDLFPAALSELQASYGKSMGYLLTTLSFFGGVAMIMLIDRFVPEVHNPHEVHRVEELKEETLQQEKDDGPEILRQSKANNSDARLLRMGLVTAITIAIHNFPEGMATFISALKDPKLGASIAVAIAIHNIPEGLAVAIPVYYATSSRKKAFFYSFASGLSEPLGALIGYAILLPFLNDTLFGMIYGVIAGIMVYISLDELLPTAEEYGHHHVAIAGVVLGMLVMAVSLVLLV